MEDRKPFGKKLSEALGSRSSDTPAEAAPTDDPPEIDPGPCASVPRGKWVTALEIRHPGDREWEAFQFKDISTRSEFTPTRFVVVFEGREERYRVIAKGRNLHGIYCLILQGRLEWIEAATRDFAENGKPVITSIEVVKEKIKS